jgi:hypothetical protein
MIELYSVNVMFGLSYLQNQKLNLIQRVVFLKLFEKFVKSKKLILFKKF